MRLFVAVSLESGLATLLDSALAPYRAKAPRARWVPPANYHFTLKFIGSWPEPREPELIGALARVQARAFSISLAGLGFFPAPNRPRLLWAGVRDPQLLAWLADLVDRACVSVGIPAEARPFSPHLTIARAVAPPDLRSLENEIADGRPSWGSQVVQAFHLFESRTLPSGPVYTPRASFPLGGSAA